MPYTRPSPAAASATFVGASAYTRPGPAAADASFRLAADGIVTGFAPVRFGTPRLFPGFVIGFKPTRFGTPVGTAPMYVATLGVITKFSWPQRATAASTRRVSFGTPFATSSTTTRTGVIAGVPGLSPVQFGTPSAVRPRTVVASGFKSLALGTPTARRAAAAAGFRPLSIGTPVAVRRTLVQGVSSAVFGLPKAVIGARVLSLGQQPSFGVPVADFPRGRKVAPIYPVLKVGVAAAFSGYVRQAVSLGTAPRFGTPTVRRLHRASMIPPTAKVGTPLLQRGTSC